MKNDKTNTLTQLDALTGLRFFAALGVVLFHVQFSLTESVGRTVFHAGGLGVTFFFILSGFILCHVYSAKPVGLLEFYRKRAARILPLHYLTLFVWCNVFFNAWGIDYSAKIPSFFANFFLLHAFFGGAQYNLGYNAVSWSISVEAFFYLLFPFILVKSRSVVILIAYIAFMLLLPNALAKELSDGYTNFFYFNPLSRLMEFSAGIVLYKFFAGMQCNYRLATCLQLFSIVLLAFIIPPVVLLPQNIENVIFLVPFCLMIYAFSSRGFFERILANKIFVILGEASFALYMTHQMLFRYIDPLIKPVPRVLALLLAVGAAILLSVMLHYCFEKPMQRLLLRKKTVVSQKLVSAEN